MSVCICKKLSLLSHCTLIFSHFEKVWREWNDPEDVSVDVNPISLSLSLSLISSVSDSLEYRLKRDL